MSTSNWIILWRETAATYNCAVEFRDVDLETVDQLARDLAQMHNDVFLYEISGQRRPYVKCVL